MDLKDLIREYEKCCSEACASEACAAIKTLIAYISKSKAGTMQELRTQIQEAMQTLIAQPGPTASIESGLELFFHCVTYTALDHPNFQDTINLFVERGTLFLENISKCRGKIGKVAGKFITSGMVILTHGRSRTVLEVLQQAALENKKFTVYVTQSMPDKAGEKMARELKDLGVDSIVILDSSVGYMMEVVDMVLVGAEGVVQDGGIVNKIGTFNIALAAKAVNVPFYVVSEWFKFSTKFFLNQHDVPDHYKFSKAELSSCADKNSLHPRVDYTPASHVTLLFTDSGVLTPAAVNDRLMGLYL